MQGTIHVGLGLGSFFGWVYCKVIASCSSVFGNWILHLSYCILHLPAFEEPQPTPSIFFSSFLFFSSSPTQLFFLELAFLFWVLDLFPKQVFRKDINTLREWPFQKKIFFTSKNSVSKMTILKAIKCTSRKAILDCNFCFQNGSSIS